MISEKTSQNVNVAESLQDIGERLRILRLQKNLDLEIVSKNTNILVKHLKSIESGDLNSLPELVYIRGFVRRYAQFLQQDAQSFELGGVQQSAFPSLNKKKGSVLFGEVIHKLKYPLYGFLVITVGSGLVYLNNQEFSPAPAQSVIETPVVSQSSP